MVKATLPQLMQSNDFVFVAVMVTVIIAINVALLLLVIAIGPLVCALLKAKRAGDEKESAASVARLASRVFVKTTVTLVVWTIVAYAAFCLLNISRLQSRLFIVLAGIICSLAAFAESVRRILRNRQDCSRRNGKWGRI